MRRRVAVSTSTCMPVTSDSTDAGSRAASAADICRCKWQKTLMPQIQDIVLRQRGFTISMRFCRFKIDMAPESTFMYTLIYLRRALLRHLLYGASKHFAARYRRFAIGLTPGGALAISARLFAVTSIATSYDAY